VTATASARRPQSTRVVKPALFAACLVPLALLIGRALANDLTANPIQFITHRTGDWALRFLILTLAISPLRWLTGWHEVIRLRRMFGLFAFFYATLHMLTYVVLDYFFAFDLMWENLLKARYITAGMAAFVLMIPLAATSTQAMIGRLGGRRWQAVHRLVYASAIAAVVHYMWRMKVDPRTPLLYGVVLLMLLGFRVWHHYDRRRGASSIAADDGTPRRGGRKDDRVFRDGRRGSLEGL
jgi:sulfoxide reductase heme-binding subunit YedZ